MLVVEQEDNLAQEIDKDLRVIGLAQIIAEQVPTEVPKTLELQVPLTIVKEVVIEDLESVQIRILREQDLLQVT